MTDFQVIQLIETMLANALSTFSETGTSVTLAERANLLADQVDGIWTAVHNHLYDRDEVMFSTGIYQWKGIQN